MNIYLSPHCDDVCFSIANLAERYGGLLISIFTRSNFTATDIKGQYQTDELIQIVQKQREAEDIAFATQAGLDRYDFELDDSILSTQNPFTSGDISLDVDNLKLRLLPVLQKEFSQNRSPHKNILFCPMAIGGHRDHKITLMSVVSEIEQLRSLCRIAFYEDLPYASDPSLRSEGLDNLKSVTGIKEWSTIVTYLSHADAERKLSLIQIYTSQHSEKPQAFDYIPASRLSNSLHEIYRLIY